MRRTGRNGGERGDEDDKKGLGVVKSCGKWKFVIRDTLFLSLACVGRGGLVGRLYGGG